MRLFSKAAGLSEYRATGAVERRGFFPNQYDLAAIALILAGLVLVVAGGRQMTAPVTLDPRNLPEYALRTTLRMFAAILASLIFTFVVATLAAKSRKAELVIIPALDILQSVPVLGFLTFTVVFFMRLFPGSQLGAECAAIFAIFTSQAWNMAFSFYQSLRTVPRDLDEVSRHFRLSPLAALLAARGAVRDARPDLEHHDVDVGRLVLRGRLGGDHGRRHDRQAARHRLLGGAGDRAAGHRRRRDGGRHHGRGDPGSTTSCCFRPIVAWADKFRFEQTAAQQRPHSWVYDLGRRGRLIQPYRPAPLGGALPGRACRASASPAGRSAAPIAARRSSPPRRLASGWRSCSRGRLRALVDRRLSSARRSALSDFARRSGSAASRCCASSC